MGSIYMLGGSGGGGASTPVVRCLLTTAATQSIAQNAVVDVTWDTELSDPSNMHTVGAAAVTVPQAGLYRVEAAITYPSPAAGVALECIVKVNGVYQYADRVIAQGAATQVSVLVSQTLVLSASNTVTIAAFHNSVGALSINGNVNYAWFNVVYLGPQ